MGAGADGEGGFAGFEVIDDVLHGVVGEFAEAEEEDEVVGGAGGGDAGDIVGGIRVDVAGFLIDGEEDGGVEAVTGAEELREHGGGFLGAVFFVAGEEDDVFAFSGAFGAVEVEPWVRGWEGGRAEEGEESEAAEHDGVGKTGCRDGSGVKGWRNPAGASRNVMNTQTSFQIFGPSHLVALGVTGLVAAWMIRSARRGRPALAERGLAALLLICYPLTLLVQVVDGGEVSGPVLPMHLCDWAAVVSALGLLLRRVVLAELAWFWGLAGTLNGLLTPNLQADFPSLRYHQFFLQHGGVVAAAIYLVYGAGLKPRPGAARRAYAGLLGYAVVAAAVNEVTGANYGFLCAKPGAASLMDALGPWPYYIGGLLLVAGVFFFLLELPFRRGSEK